MQRELQMSSPSSRHAQRRPPILEDIPQPNFAAPVPQPPAPAPVPAPAPLQPAYHPGQYYHHQYPYGYQPFAPMPMPAPAPAPAYHANHMPVPVQAYQGLPRHSIAHHDRQLNYCQQHTNWNEGLHDGFQQRKNTCLQRRNAQAANPQQRNQELEQHEEQNEAQHAFQHGQHLQAIQQQAALQMQQSFQAQQEAQHQQDIRHRTAQLSQAHVSHIQNQLHIHGPHQVQSIQTQRQGAQNTICQSLEQQQEAQVS